MLNEDTIVSRRTTPPSVDSSNTFTEHPPCAWQVTWGIINCNRGREYTDFGCVGKNGTVGQRNIIEFNVCINLYQLFIEEAPNEVWKVRDIEMDTETLNREREITNCTIYLWLEIKRWNYIDSLGFCARITSLSISPSTAPPSSSSSSWRLLTGGAGGSGGISGGRNCWLSIPLDHMTNATVFSTINSHIINMTVTYLRTPTTLHLPSLLPSICLPSSRNSIAPVWYVSKHYFFFMTYLRIPVVHWSVPSRSQPSTYSPPIYLLTFESQLYSSSMVRQ